MSKSKAKAIREELEFIPKKQPKVPAYPPVAHELAQKLGQIIDAGGEGYHTAYGALSRMAVLWATDPVTLGDRLPWAIQMLSEVFDRTCELHIKRDVQVMSLLTQSATAV